MEAKRENYMVINFKEDVISYQPAIERVRFQLFDASEIKPFIFFNQTAASKIQWVVNYLEHIKKPVDLIFVIENFKTAEMTIAMMAPDFPISEFARYFDLPRIQEKKISAMDFVVAAYQKLEILSDSFFSWLRKDNPGCELTIGQINKNGWIEEEVATVTTNIEVRPNALNKIH